MKAENLLGDIPAEIAEELCTKILSADGLRIERIVSQGQASGPGFWYDQPESEWVLVLEGSAVVQFAGDPELVELERGSFLKIPAHARHRVVRTDPKLKTIWLAIHYRG
jgi:cupin 2 domain-containing protein